MFKTLREKLSRIKKEARDLKPHEIIVEDEGRLIKEKRLDELLDELEFSFIEADVSIEVIEEIKKGFRNVLKGKKVAKGLDLDDAIETVLMNTIKKILFKPMDFLKFVDESEKPVVVMFVGVNGTGKTTVIAKVAHLLLTNKKSCVLAASDTFRAGAIEQLEIHSQNLDVKMIKHKAGSDPAAVSYDAVEHARAKHKDVVLIDTAGRMQTNVNLMDEMKKIKRVAKPDMIIFVGDSLAGNDAVNQARTFDEAVGIDASVLTKIDADAKGGAALSIAFVTRKPILFLGTGQEYKDLIPFKPAWMVNRLFGD
ncbi:MAG: signal recognition particle-docking protein FtsY [Thermoplasmata archaeon]|nr:signal recognition particle-docking protein FtsY [Thermoplasmata archaeon]